MFIREEEVCQRGKLLLYKIESIRILVVVNRISKDYTVHKL